MTIDQTKQFCVGLEINANHLKSVKEGMSSITKPIHLGKNPGMGDKANESGDLTCISRITIVFDRK